MQKKREEKGCDASQGAWFLKVAKEKEDGDGDGDILTNFLFISSAVCQLLPSSSTSRAGLPSGIWLSLLLSPS